MKLSEMSTRELKRALRATERMTGPDSYEVRVLRAELVRRREEFAGKKAERITGGNA